MKKKKKGKNRLKIKLETKQYPWIKDETLPSNTYSMHILNIQNTENER